MKRWLAVFVLALTPAFAQSVQRSNPAPQLSTADRIALQSCEKIKQDAQKQWQDALQQEQAILTEFNTSHPGYRVNPQNFVVEPEQTKPEQPKPALSEKK
jgi:Skp family chaperone for outer membrane proteins